MKSNTKVPCNSTIVASSLLDNQFPLVRLYLSCWFFIATMVLFSLLSVARFLDKLKMCHCWGLHMHVTS